MHKEFGWEKLEGWTPLGRPRRRWEYNIKMDSQGVEGGIEWIDRTLDGDRWRAVVNAGMDLRLP